MHSGVPPGTAHTPLTALAAMRGRRATAAIDLSAGTVLPPLLVVHGSLDGVVSSRNAEAAESFPDQGRIDHCFVSPGLAPRLAKAWIDQTANGSDHWPVFVEMKGG